MQYSQYLEIKIVYVNKFYYILYFFDFVYSPNKHFDKMLGQPHELNTKDTMLCQLTWHQKVFSLTKTLTTWRH